MARVQPRERFEDYQARVVAQADEQWLKSRVEREIRLMKLQAREAPSVEMRLGWVGVVAAAMSGFVLALILMALLTWGQ